MESLSGPDLTAGVLLTDIADGGTLLGHRAGEAALLVRQGDAVFAVSARCTHYGLSLGSGLVGEDTIRCPWHHACFSLRIGEALKAPALTPLTCWNVIRDGDRVKIASRKLEPPAKVAPTNVPESVVIIGGGAAGTAAAEMLRREGYDGPVTLLSAEDLLPIDRPNLSKEYLAGEAPEERTFPAGYSSSALSASPGFASPNVITQRTSSASQS